MQPETINCIRTLLNERAQTLFENLQCMIFASRLDDVSKDSAVITALNNYAAVLRARDDYDQEVP